MATEYALNDNNRVEFLREQIEWANGVLARPNVKYANGKWSHEAAGAVLDASESELLDHVELHVTR